MSDGSRFPRRRGWSDSGWAWQDAERLRDEFWHFVGDPAQEMIGRVAGPRVDVVQTANEVIVRAEVPGFEPDQVEIRVFEDRIVLRGEVNEQQDVENGKFFRRERRSGSFYRVVPLDAPVLADQATARFRNGVLEVRVPKAEGEGEGFQPRFEE